MKRRTVGLVAYLVIVTALLLVILGIRVGAHLVFPAEVQFVLDTALTVCELAWCGWMVWLGVRWALGRKEDTRA